VDKGDRAEKTPVPSSVLRFPTCQPIKRGVSRRLLHSAFCLLHWPRFRVKLDQAQSRRVKARKKIYGPAAGVRPPLSVPPVQGDAMNHETNCQGSRVGEMSDADLGIANIQHRTLNIEYGEEARPAFDDVKASQARSDLIKAKIIFFGLDGECPSHSCKVTPC
jgi:hypothetical protein